MRSRSRVEEEKCHFQTASFKPFSFCRSQARGVAAEMLCVYGGLTQVEAGRHLGMGTSGAVSIRRKHFAEMRSKDKSLNKQSILIEQELDREMA
jgi:hypothetical protein